MWGTDLRKNPGVKLIDVNNQVDTRTIYPEAQGATLGGRGSALTPFSSSGFKAQQMPTIQGILARLSQV